MTKSVHSKLKTIQDDILAALPNSLRSRWLSSAHYFPSGEVRGNMCLSMAEHWHYARQLADLMHGGELSRRDTEAAWSCWLKLESLWLGAFRATHNFDCAHDPYNFSRHAKSA